MDANPRPDGQKVPPTLAARTKAARINEKRIFGDKFNPLTIGVERPACGTALASDRGGHRGRSARLMGWASLGNLKR